MGEKKGRTKKGRAMMRDINSSVIGASHGEGQKEIFEGAVSAELVDGSELVDGAVDFSSPVVSTSVRCGTSYSDESASTRASSEEPADAHQARRLMEQMGWRPEAVDEAALDGAEVAAWRKQHPRYQQAVHEERQKLKTQFQNWARATV